MSDRAVGVAGSTPLLEAVDVAREYALAGLPVRAVRGVSLEIADGDYAAIVGPSGCGKSSLLNLLGAIDRPTSGRILLRGRDVSRMSDREATEFRLRHIGFVFQRFYLMPMLTALENVELPMAEAGVAKAARRLRARELLSYVGLESRGGHRPAQLSGGEQQRVAIARALANEPALLLADEPTGELDARTGQEVIRLFDRLHDDGVTILVVTHDESLARAARRVVHMVDGTIVADERTGGLAGEGAPAGPHGSGRATERRDARSDLGATPGGGPISGSGPTLRREAVAGDGAAIRSDAPLGGEVPLRGDAASSGEAALGGEAALRGKAALGVEAALDGGAGAGPPPQRQHAPAAPPAHHHSGAPRIIPFPKR